jgi:phosphomannomutase
VSKLTSALVSEYVRAFLAAFPIGTGLYVARNLRPSSPDIAAAVTATACGAGIQVTDCGEAPTPALPSMHAGAAAVMITGSHIPVDRNGLKFYLRDGEISKADEAAILAALGSAPAAIGTDQGTLRSGEVGLS